MFSLDLVKEGTSAVITLSGELDLSTVDEFSVCASASLREGSTRKLVVDLRRVTFLDCTGLASLIELQGEPKRRPSVSRCAAYLRVSDVFWTYLACATTSP